MDKTSRPLSKGHHFVPRLHLQHFAGAEPKGQVWTYDKTLGKVWSGLPEETAKQTYFNSVENGDGTWDTALEDLIGEVENKSAGIYEQLLNGHLPDDGTDAKTDFARFVAYQQVRTPAARQDAADIVAKTYQIHLAANAANKDAFAGLVKRFERAEGKQLGSAVIERLRAEMRNPSRFTLVVPKQATFSLFSVAEDLVGVFRQMRWSLIQAASGFFISSDHPLVRWTHPSTQHPILGDHGFLNKTAEVTLPLSPDIMLLMTWSDDLPKRALLAEQHVEWLNELRAFHADRQIYSHVNSPILKHLASTYAGSRPRLNMEGLEGGRFGAVEVPRKMPTPPTRP